MDKVLLIDYYGTCNREGELVGHSNKVIKEYGELLKGEFDVGVAVSPCMVAGMKNEFNEVIQLKYNIYTNTAIRLSGKIKDKIKLYINIYQALKVGGYDIYWFIRSDFFLFLYLNVLCIIKKRKMIALIYQSEYGGEKLKRIINCIFRLGIHKLDGIIYTQKNLKTLHSKGLYIPDYYYDEKKYEKYKKLKKKDKAVCIGTMNTYKRLEELVDAFNRNGMYLEIIGYFYEKDRVHKLKSIAKENVYIEDAILSDDRYYSLLAESKFSVLPYDMKEYNQRSSGVLLESIFLDTIVVAPQELLRQNNVKGIGYNSITQLEEPEFFNKWLDQANVNVEYDKKKISKDLINFLKIVKN